MLSVNPYCFKTSLSLHSILLPFHKPCLCCQSVLLPLYLLTGGPRSGRGERRGWGDACCFLIIIGVFMVILLLIKVLRETWGWKDWQMGRMERGMKVHESQRDGWMDGEECMEWGRWNKAEGGDIQRETAEGDNDKMQSFHFSIHEGSVLLSHSVCIKKVQTQRRLDEWEKKQQVKQRLMNKTTVICIHSESVSTWQGLGHRALERCQWLSQQLIQFVLTGPEHAGSLKQRSCTLDGQMKIRCHFSPVMQLLSGNGQIPDISMFSREKGWGRACKAYNLYI